MQEMRKIKEKGCKDKVYLYLREGGSSKETKDEKIVVWQI